MTECCGSRLRCRSSWGWKGYIADKDVKEVLVVLAIYSIITIMVVIGVAIWLDFKTLIETASDPIWYYMMGIFIGIAIMPWIVFVIMVSNLRSVYANEYLKLRLDNELLTNVAAKAYERAGHAVTMQTNHFTFIAEKSGQRKLVAIDKSGNMDDQNGAAFHAGLDVIRNMEERMASGGIKRGHAFVNCHETLKQHVRNSNIKCMGLKDLAMLAYRTRVPEDDALLELDPCGTCGLVH